MEHAPISFLQLIRARTPLVAVMLASLLGLGCHRKPKTIEIDHRFSYNVARVPSWFPAEKRVPMRRKIAHVMTLGLVSDNPPVGSSLSPAEQEVLDRKGKPNFIRFYWNPQGTFITSSDLSGKNLDLADILKETKRTWIYVADKTEIEFHENGSRYDVHPVTEKLQLICAYGDPTGKTPPKPDKGGRMHESWEWVEQGIRIEFVDDKELHRDYFHEPAPEPF